jgi:translation initiation factor 2 subunit 3
MAKESKIERPNKEKEGLTEIESINLGMVGHIDHGKTTLLQKLSGKWTDTHSEELKRGITIKLGYAEAVIRKDEKGVYNIKKGTPIRYVSFIDSPGHEMLMANMLSGAAIIDGAILLIAANEGVKPQTREHLTALEAKKVKQIIIVQNKIDLVSKEDALKNYKEIKEFVKGTIAENSPIIPVSALQEINIDKVLEEVCKMKILEKDTKSEPIFLIARSFDINRPGTIASEIHGGVLGGVLKKGILSVGDKIEIKPGILVKKGNQQFYETVKSKIVSIRKGNVNVEKAEPGVSLAIETELDNTFTKADTLSGCIMGKENTLPEIKYSLKIKYTLFNEIFGLEGHQKVEPLKTMERLLLSINTAITVGTIKIIKGDTMEVNLNVPIVPFKDDSVGIARNINSHWRLIGFGEISG